MSFRLSNFYLYLPILAVLFPQGTTSRDWIFEGIFFLFLLLSIIFSLILQRKAQGKIKKFELNYVLIMFLLYFAVFNPVISMLNYSSFTAIVITALPFTLLGFYYLFFLARFNNLFIKNFINFLVISGVINSLFIFYVSILNGYSDSEYRSTQIEGIRTLTLPIMPISATIVSIWALAENNKKLFYLYSFTSMLILSALMLTQTRGMLLAFLAGLIFSIFYLTKKFFKGKKIRIFSRLIFVIFLGFLVLSPILLRLLLRFDINDTSSLGTILGRIDEYIIFFNGFLSSPIFGQGLGHIFQGYSAYDMTLYTKGITICHGHPFFFLGTTGIVGFSLYYLLIAQAFFSLSSKKLFIAVNERYQIIIISLNCGLIAGFIFTLSSTTFNSMSYNLFLAFYIFCAAYFKQESNKMKLS